MLAVASTLVTAYVVSPLARAPSAQPALRRAPALLAGRRLGNPVAQEGAATASDSAVFTDTLLDVGVYSLLFLVVALTVYSLVVTLQKSNDEYGGWTPRDDEEVSRAARSDDGRLRAGARYDPITEQWTYPDAQQSTAKVGRAPTAASGVADADSGNRYEKRMMKKQKQKQKKARKGNK